MSEVNHSRTPVPRDRENDYSPEAARVRREFVRQQTGVDLHHVGSFSFAPSLLAGNIENFAGVAQVPIGIAGPLLVNGEHAQGEFYVPLATTEGTLVASYNRGMRLLNECGGVKTAVVDEHMQRAPVFILEDALGGRKFGEWVADHFADIKQQAETTTTLREVDLDRAVLGRAAALSAVQLHHGRRRGAEHDRQSDARRV